MFSTSRFRTRGNGRTRGPLSDLPARRAPVLGVTAKVDAAACIVAVERPDGSLRRLLPDLRLGCTLGVAFRGLDETLADGLHEAAEHNLTVAGRTLGGDARLPLTVDYDLHPSPSGSGTDLTLWTAPATPDDLATLSGSAAHGARTRARILSLANRGANPEQAGRAALPLLVEALGVSCAAVYTVDHGSAATLLAAFGATRRRVFPYPRLELGVSPLSPLVLQPGVMAFSDSRAAELPSELLDVCPSRCGFVALSPCFAGHALTGILAVSRTTSEPLSIERLRPHLVGCGRTGTRSRQLGSVAGEPPQRSGARDRLHSRPRDLREPRSE